jgi:hypothetical protein
MPITPVKIGRFIDADVTPDEARVVVASIRVEVSYKCDERNGTCTVPLYEVCLLHRMYQLMGGRLTARGTWPRGANVDPRARLIVLNRANWRNEVERLKMTYFSLRFQVTNPC